MRIGHGYQGRMMHSHSMDHVYLYKQLVEYCCGSLSKFSCKYTTRVPHQIFLLRYLLIVLLLNLVSSGCHNSQIRNMPERRNHSWKNYKRYQKSMGTLSDTCRCKSQITLASVDILCLCILKLGSKYYQEVEHEESQTSGYGYSEQYTILVNFQAKKLQSIYTS